MLKTRQLVGHIGVDAGICWIGDPCYIFHQKKPPKAIGKNWADFCNKTDSQYPTLQQFNYDLGHPGLGVLVSTGYGDGYYPVYAELEDGVVARVTVDFVGEAEEEE